MLSNTPLQSSETYYIAAEIITNTILGVPYYNYSIIYPPHPILSIKAPRIQL